MDTSPQIQAYILTSFAVFVVFGVVLVILLVNLQMKRIFLSRAQKELKIYADDLEAKVQERTAALRDSEFNYRNLFENAKEPIIIIASENKKIIDVNNEAVRLFGFSKAEFIDVPFDRLIFTHIDLGINNQWNEHIVSLKNQSQRYVDSLVGEIVFNGIPAKQVIFRDITDRKFIEAQLSQAQRTALLSQLAAGVAHELNSPLGTIANSTYFLETELGKVSPKAEKHLHLIADQVSICTKIVRDLRAGISYGELDSDPELININEIISNCISQVGDRLKSKGIDVICELAEVPKVLVEPQNLQIVFMNLIRNAQQAMPNGGKLVVCTWKDEGIRNILGMESNDCAVHAKFKDSGIGIDQDDLHKLFAPFFTTKKKLGGLGLGLYVSNEIVKRFHGNITVESTINKGTEFIINLPVVKS